MTDKQSKERMQRLNDALQSMPTGEEIIQGANIDMSVDEDYRRLALQRLYDLNSTYKIKHTNLYYTPFKDEAALLQHTQSILNMMHPWLYYIRQDAKTRCGIPDITGCLNGRFFAFELKDNIGKPSAPQIKNITSINEAHGLAACPKTIYQVFTQLFACFGIYNF